MARSYTATERMEGSRSATQRAVARELMLVSILSRIWPAHLCEPRKKQANYRYLVCLHSPAGELLWRVAEDEMEMFTHLEQQPNHAAEYVAGDKEALLLLLATDHAPDINK